MGHNLSRSAGKLVFSLPRDLTDSEEGFMSYGAGGGTQQPPVRPPIPPIPPQGSVPPGGTGSPRAWVVVLLVGGALLILGLLVAGVFIAADNASTGDADSTGSTATEEQDADMVSVVSDDSELQLQVPASWENLKGDLNPVASIEVGDKFDETYAMVISDSRDVFGDPPPLENFARAQLRYFTRRLESPSLSEGVSVAEYEQNAVRHELSATVDNINVKYMITFLETDQRFVQIFAWTLTPEWENNRGILERVSNSLQELSTG